MKQIIQKTWMVITMLLMSLSSYAYDFEVDGIYYNVVSLQDMTCKVTKGEYTGDIQIPSEVTYNGRKFTVTAIEKEAFYDSSLTSISIPESVTSIGFWAFFSCDRLKHINIPNTVTYLGDCAFKGCTSLKDVIIGESVVSIGKYAFENCKSITSLVIPNSVKTIGEGAFDNCVSLEEIELSDQLTKLEPTLFYGCESLKSITIPGSVKDVKWIDKEESIFGHCESLKEIRFLYGDSQLSVGKLSKADYISDKWTEDWRYLEIEKLYIDRDLVFDANNFALKYVKEATLGSHILKCPYVIPTMCENIKVITCYSLVPPSVDYEFSNAQYMNVVVKVPQQALEVYQQADVWKNFWNIEGFEYSGVEELESDLNNKSVVGIYDISGHAVSEEYQGLVIVRFSDGTCKKMVNLLK